MGIRLPIAVGCNRKNSFIFIIFIIYYYLFIYFFFKFKAYKHRKLLASGASFSALSAFGQCSLVTETPNSEQVVMRLHFYKMFSPFSFLFLNPFLLKHFLSLIHISLVLSRGKPTPQLSLILP